MLAAWRRNVLLSLGLITCGAAVPAAHLCGEAIASGVQRGTFTEIALGAPCDTRDSTGPVVSLAAGDVAPIFWIGQIVDGACRMTLGTIENDAFVAIARTTLDVGDRPPVDLGNGTYLGASSAGDKYLRFDARARREDDVPLVTDGARIRSLAADARGEAYAIEASIAGGGEARLVDIGTRTSQPLPARTYTKSLKRGADGRLYFEQYSTQRDSRKPCSLFAIDATGHAVETTSCEVGGDTTVGPSGTVWDSTELGVVLREPAAGTSTRYAPIYAPPCDSFSPYSSYAHNVVADERGNAWFVFGKLWHVDRRGNVYSIAIPDRARSGAATRGLFETADGTLWLFSKRSVEHFVP